MNFTSFDIIGDLAYAESFGCLAKVELHPWIQLTFDFLKAAVYIQILQWIPGALALTNSILPPSVRKSRDYHLQLTTEKVKHRVAIESLRPDFMENIVATMQDEDGLTMGELEATSEVIIIAGSETTATLLTGAFFYLLTNPHAYKRLVEEIRGTFADEKDMKHDTLKNCKYLLAVLDETLRLYPPVPTTMQRMVPGDGDYIEGQWVPGGTKVGVAHWFVILSFPGEHTCGSYQRLTT
jgi:cytochrome P450